eukprot:1154308-Pelagomonas_calceolata.AAC.1
MAEQAAKPVAFPSTYHWQNSGRINGRLGYMGFWPSAGWFDCSACWSLSDSQKTIHGIRNEAIQLIRVQGLQRVGLQPENLADRLLVKHSHPASKIGNNSDKNLYESGFRTASTLKSANVKAHQERN